MIKLLRRESCEGFEFTLKMRLVGVAEVLDIVRDAFAWCGEHFCQCRLKTEDSAVMLRAVAYMTEEQTVDMALRVAQGGRKLMDGNRTMGGTYRFHDIVHRLTGCSSLQLWLKIITEPCDAFLE